MTKKSFLRQNKHINYMNILVPLLSGEETNPYFVDNFLKKATKVILLQIVDKNFLSKTSAAMGEVMQYHTLLNDLKKILKTKKKECEEITEWGNTTQKIVSIAILQKVDTVYLVKQKNQFFGDILKALEKEKIKYEVIELPKDENEKKKGFSFFGK